jgi:hypothetical protein
MHLVPHEARSSIDEVAPFRETLLELFFEALGHRDAIRYDDHLLCPILHDPSLAQPRAMVATFIGLSKKLDLHVSVQHRARSTQPKRVSAPPENA